MTKGPTPSRPRAHVIALIVVPLAAMAVYGAIDHAPVVLPTHQSRTMAMTAQSVPPPRRAVVEHVAAIPTPAADALVVRRILDTGGPIPYGDYFWDEAGVASGPLIITVDLGAETISAFRGGYEIGTAAIIFGDKGRETPLGVFPITQKDADHVSNLYDAPMPYMLRLTNDGISIHGSKASWEYATHGCIGVPIGFAKKLFGATKLGDRVIVTRGKMLDLGEQIEAPAA